MLRDKMNGGASAANLSRLSNHRSPPSPTFIGAPRPERSVAAAEFGQQYGTVQRDELAGSRRSDTDVRRHRNWSRISPLLPRFS